MLVMPWILYKLCAVYVINRYRKQINSKLCFWAFRENFTSQNLPSSYMVHEH